MRVIGRAAAELKRLTAPRSKVLPGALSFLSRLTPVFGMVASILDQLNGYALVYVGITGDGFWPSARRAVSLASRRNSGKLLDCKWLLPIVIRTNDRHSHQTTPHDRIDCDWHVHSYRGVPLHGTQHGKS